MKKVSVECRNIYLSYGKTDVLKGVNLLVHPGEFFETNRALRVLENPRYCA